MQFSFTTDQHEFAAGLREMLEREFTAARLRELWDAGAGHDARLWERLAEMGVLGMMVPESDGGLGGDFVDTILLLEELGRAAVPGPVLESAVVGALAVRGTSPAAGIANGTTLVTAALMGERFVPHADVADLVLLADEAGLRAVDIASVTVAPVEGIDGGRHLATVTGTHGAGTFLAVDRELVADAGALATAAYLLGLSSRMLAIAGDYARDRRQFGQPIGAFQAVKHLMADALLKVEFARPAIYRAAWSFDHDPDNRGRDVSMAKSLASDAAQKAARSALQVHGAIGYTWECDLQLFMKKAWALIPAWGNATFHRRRVAECVLGPR
ncbi:MAG TPA: acyl-CoA dehydrogenase family protein [Ilumatobacteraceae bacterium]|jgi:alkylation response protein AidB-like acyl-CoA dehydrogenase